MPTPTGTATWWSVGTHVAALALGALLTYLYVQLTYRRGGDRKDAPALAPSSGTTPPYAPGWPYGLDVLTSPHVPPGTVLLVHPGTTRSWASWDPATPHEERAIRLDPHAVTRLTVTHPEVPLPPA